MQHHHVMNEQPATTATTRLSPHFTLEEMTASGTARRYAIDNTPQDVHIECLRNLCRTTLEPIRRRFGVLRITSGYRSPALNKRVGGATGSQHTRGEAADIHVSDRDAALKMAEYVRRHVNYDQLIVEHRRSTGAYWVHVSCRLDAAKNRHEYLEQTV